MSVHTLSYDEKPGMQALDTTTDDKPPVSGTKKSSTIYWDYEYVRLGTLFLLAAIDLLTGEAVPLVNPIHKNSENRNSKIYGQGRGGAGVQSE